MLDEDKKINIHHEVHSSIEFMNEIIKMDYTKTYTYLFDYNNSWLLILMYLQGHCQGQLRSVCTYATRACYRLDKLKWFIDLCSAQYNYDFQHFLMSIKIFIQYYNKNYIIA